MTDIDANVASLQFQIKLENTKKQELRVNLCFPNLTMEQRALLSGSPDNVLHPNLDPELRAEHVVPLLRKTGELGTTLVDHQISKFATKFVNHFFANSRFYTKVAKGDFPSAARWHGHVRLFSHVLIFIPVLLELSGDSNHWLLVVIDVPKAQIRLYNSYAAFSSSRNERVLKLVKDYLIFLENSQIEQNIGVSHFETIDVSTAPRQSDAVSCGVFVLTNMALLAESRPLDYQQGHVFYARRLLAQEVLSGDVFPRWQPMIYGYQ